MRILATRTTKSHHLFDGSNHSPFCLKVQEQRRVSRVFLGLFLLGMAMVSQEAGALAGPKEQMRKQQPELPSLKPKIVRDIGKETVEADVSTHSIAVTSGFSGTKIVIFGAVNRPFPLAPDPSVYDVIVAVEGKSEPLIVRKKSNVFGLWINLGSLRFESTPSYYTMASTRPISQIADGSVLERHQIGFEHVNMTLSRNALGIRSRKEITQYQKAVIRLKRKAHLYQQQDHGVKFIGKSLFRSSFDLPADVPVGPLKASIYLFRDGNLLAQFTSHVELRREGLQRWLYDMAFNYPLFYGLMAVFFATIAGLTASAVFRRKSV